MVTRCPGPRRHVGFHQKMWTRSAFMKSAGLIYTTRNSQRSQALGQNVEAAAQAACASCPDRPQLCLCAHKTACACTRCHQPDGAECVGEPAAPMAGYRCLNDSTAAGDILTGQIRPGQAGFGGAGCLALDETRLRTRCVRRMAASGRPRCSAGCRALQACTPVDFITFTPPTPSRLLILNGDRLSPRTHSRRRHAEALPALRPWHYAAVQCYHSHCNDMVLFCNITH
jgi:hypothetical protein